MATKALGQGISVKHDFFEINEIQSDYQHKSGILNVIKEGITNFKYLHFDIESYLLFRRFEVVADKKIRR